MSDYGGRLLAEMTTLALPASAEHFCDATSTEQCREALDYARGRAMPVLMLGGGSNVVLGGRIPGLVLRLGNRGVDVLEQDAAAVLLRVAAGEDWHGLVCHCLERGWFGLENLAMIPGRVGAAPIQNIGAYGVELSDVCTAVEVIDIGSGEGAVLPAADCRFEYRNSAFKMEWQDRFAITAVRLRLSMRPQVNRDYLPLAEELDRLPGEDTPRKVFEAVCRIRRRKLPDPEQLPNVGSFFKNPIVTVDQYQDLLAEFPGIVSWPFGDRFKLAAAWLLEQDGWKGYGEGAVGTHERQPLVLVNHGGASAADVLDLAARIQGSIQRRYGIRLDIEPRVYLGAGA